MMKKHIRVVAAVVQQDGKYLITQRRPTAILPLYWEFPGGKVEAGEKDEVALQRELKERLGAEFHIDQKLTEKQHVRKEYTIDLALYEASLLPGQNLQPLRVNDFRWVPSAEMGFFQFSDLDHQARELITLEE